jgi:hypothetical protein
LDPRIPINLRQKLLEIHEHERAQQCHPWSNVYQFRERELLQQPRLETQPSYSPETLLYSLGERLLAATLIHSSTVSLWRRQLFAWISDDGLQYETATARRGKPTGSGGRASDASSVVLGSTGSPPIMLFAIEAMLNRSLCNLILGREWKKNSRTRRRSSGLLSQACRVGATAAGSLKRKGSSILFHQRCISSWVSLRGMLASR